MRKIFVFCMAVCLSSVVYALPLDNPALPTLLYGGVFCAPSCEEDACCPSSWWDGLSLRAGYYGDYVDNRHLRVKKEGPMKDVQQTQITTNAGYLALNWANRIDLFTTLGVSRLQLTSLEDTWLLQIPDLQGYTHLLSHTGFSWSVGLRGTLIEKGCFSLGVEGQYFYTSPDLDFFRVEGIPVHYDSFSLKYQEWQVGLGLSYKINLVSTHSWLVPYAGIDWSGAHLSMGNGSITLSNAFFPTPNVNDYHFFNMKSQHAFGYAVGVTFVGSGCWSVTGEVRFVNERAVYFNTQFAF